MANSIKKHLKYALHKAGLLKATIFIFNKFYSLNLRTYIRDLKVYLFNNILTYFPFYLIRLIYLKYVIGINVGKNCFIHMGCRFNGDISIGDNTVLGRNCVFLGDITIQENVSITAECYIFTSSHIINSPDFDCFYKKVIIEDYAWIGARSMILPGVKIGRGAVLGANSTATKNILDYSICAGSPAKEIGKRNSELKYKLNYSPYFQ